MGYVYKIKSSYVGFLPIFSMQRHRPVTISMLLSSNNENQEEPTLHSESFPQKVKRSTPKVEYRPVIKWVNVIAICTAHVIALYTLVFKLWDMKFLTLFYAVAVGVISGIGVTAGPHRLWAHRSYKATWPLKVILITLFSTAGQNNIYEWVRDHRLHHKYSETDADPHNARRGFWFAHVGWLMQKKHPEVLRRGSLIDMSDITGDPLLRLHTRYFLWIKLLCCFIVPPLVPVLGWGEDVLLSILLLDFARYMVCLNMTWLVNSAAHLYGHRPYDNSIMPVDNMLISLVTGGEGWHNYHHVFPGDYRTAEVGGLRVSPTTVFIDLCAKIGWAYDLKTASPSLVRSVLLKKTKVRLERFHNHTN